MTQAILLLGINPERNEDLVHKKTGIRMFIESLLVIAKMLETTQNIHQQENILNCGKFIQWTMHYNKNKLTTTTCSNMDEPPRHYAEWNKPDAKENIPYDSIYIKYKDRQD